MIDTLELSLKLRAAGLPIAAADAITQALFEETNTLRKLTGLSKVRESSLPFTRMFLVVTSGLGFAMISVVAGIVLAKLLIWIWSFC